MVFEDAGIVGVALVVGHWFLGLFQVEYPCRFAPQLLYHNRLQFRTFRDAVICNVSGDDHATVIIWMNRQSRGIMHPD
ncbi:MAG: hypothetical protein LR120_01515 [Dehalococcoidia bacterium]|nr:hypothetical protein [Dehalococcoidia bacterium]